jgi:intein/homing endonuclease
MKFDQFVLEKCRQVFQKYDLQIVEHLDNYIKLQSKNMIVVISHNPFENSNILWFSKNEENAKIIEIRKDTLKDFFNSDLKLSDLYDKIFVKNIVLFFENEGRPLLMGDENVIIKLEKYDYEMAVEYTKKFI